MDEEDCPKALSTPEELRAVSVRMGGMVPLLQA